MFGLGMGEVLIILVFALIFIGPKKLPELAKTIGKGFSEFQKTKNEILSDMHEPREVHQPPPQHAGPSNHEKESAIDAEYQHHDDHHANDHHDPHHEHDHHQDEEPEKTAKNDPESTSS